MPRLARGRPYGAHHADASGVVDDLIDAQEIDGPHCLHEAGECWVLLDHVSVSGARDGVEGRIGAHEHLLLGESLRGALRGHVE